MNLRWLALVPICVGLCGCSYSATLRGKIAGLAKVVELAEQNGAVRCAPRELALAKSHLEFAELELDEGFMSRAERHLTIAEPNARAAEQLSPPEHCVERSSVGLADRDQDTVLDAVDRCPDAPETFNGVDDVDGCPDDPDRDRDGILDSLDTCPLEPEDKDGYLDQDGCPDLDNDYDKVADLTDKCPLVAEDPDGFEDDDGCPDLDNDKDSVADLSDQCPNDPGSATTEPIGCPLAIVTDCEVKITQQIHFEYNKDRIRPESFPVLDAVVRVLEQLPDMKVEVQGHTDNKGAPQYNYRLSDRRSKSVVKYLFSKGITPGRLTSRGYGFDRPLLDNSTEQNRALNRRVQFVRTEGGKEGCLKSGAK